MDSLIAQARSELEDAQPTLRLVLEILEPAINREVARLYEHRAELVRRYKASPSPELATAIRALAIPALRLAKAEMAAFRKDVGGIIGFADGGVQIVNEIDLALSNAAIGEDLETAIAGWRAECGPKLEKVRAEARTRQHLLGRERDSAGASASRGIERLAKELTARPEGGERVTATAEGMRNVFVPNQ